MSEYKRGTVAKVTFPNDPPQRALWDGDLWHGEWGQTWGQTTPNITPLVCIEATREDADLLDRLTGADLLPTWRSLLERIRDAIREQTPEPEPLKRWRSVTHPNAATGPTSYLFDGEAQVGALYGCSPERAQVVVDALNAAEPKP